MNTPYRETCPNCQELTEELEDLRIMNTTLMKNQKERRFKSTWDAISCGAAFAAIIGAVVFCSFAFHACAVKPDPVQPCIDSVKVIDMGSPQIECKPGASLVSEKLQDGKSVLVQCRCSPPIADAGASDQ